MKNRKQRLIEFIEDDIRNHVFMQAEELDLEGLVRFLKNDRQLPVDWQENDYIVRANKDLQGLYMEFGV
jgi:hypothetical protein